MITEKMIFHILFASVLIIGLIFWGIANFFAMRRWQKMTPKERLNKYNETRQP